MPALGNRFDVMHWGSRLGIFEQYEGLALAGGLAFRPQYQSWGLSLTVVPEPGTGTILLSAALVLGVSRRCRNSLKQC